MSTPQRVVSLCPSVTETVFALDAGELLCGITEWCVHPVGEVEEIEKVGGTKTPDIERIAELEPDLVLMNEEENRIQDAEALEARGFAVLNTFPRDVDGAIEMVRRLGESLHREEQAAALVAEIEEARREALASKSVDPPLRVAYLVWRKPYMAVNGDTYIHDLLELAGLTNVFADAPERYPHVSEEELVTCGAQMLLLSSEPFPFTGQYAAELRSLCNLPSKHAPIVDGEYFSWYGARTPEGIRYAVQKARKLEKIAAEAGH